LYEELLNSLLKGELSLHRLDSLVGDSNKATYLRREYLERKLNLKLEKIASSILDFNEVIGRNCENTIGAVQVPLGVAGPLLVRGEYAKGEYYVPLATTEGALVASINRGCKAITLSGGASATKVISDYMARAPVFKLGSLEDALKFVKWVKDNFQLIKEVAESTTRYGRLLSIKPYLIGRYVWLRMLFSTGDAMGMNMVTIASQKAVELMEREFPGVKCVSLSGNMCVDKKPAFLNELEGRGKSVISEALVKEDVVREVLKASPEAIVEVNIVKNLLGSARAGSLSFNAHFANIIAAVFLATGQDLAQVVESSMGYTWVELRGGDLYVSVTLPSLEVGTVGGGTRLPTQREALEIMGCYGPGDPPGSNARKFAEIVASAVLAGELSLLAALSAGHLARAHERLGRGKA